MLDMIPLLNKKKVNQPEEFPNIFYDGFKLLIISLPFYLYLLKE